MILCMILLLIPLQIKTTFSLLLWLEQLFDLLNKVRNALVED